MSIAHLLRSGVQLTTVDAMHRMKPANLQRAIGTKMLTESEKCLVAEGKKRAAEGRKDLKLVIRPFDSGKRIAKRDNLLTLVERAAADQHVGIIPDGVRHRIGGPPRRIIERHDLLAEAASRGNAPAFDPRAERLLCGQSVQHRLQRRAARQPAGPPFPEPSVL
jgi:hypothetical protein